MKERGYYELIRTKLNDLLGAKFGNFHLEVTRMGF